jgi:sterol 3beta-glucosyltransferase
MRITVIALGSRGDVQPFVPLGQALQAAGHRLRVATFETFGPLITGAGLDFHPIHGDAQALLSTAVEGGLLTRRLNPLKIIPAIRRSYLTLAESLARDLSEPVLRDTQILLNQLPAHLYGGDLAEYLGVPYAIVTVIPLTRTCFRPLIGFPRAFSSLPGYNILTYRLGEQLGWQLFRKTINRWRRHTLGLSALPFRGAFESLYRQQVPFINGFSPHVVSRPPDWGDHVHLTGWWYPQDPHWEPPVELRRFLEAGPPPVFIGFGSMPAGDPSRLTTLIVEAIQLSGQRAILHSGWAGLGGQLPAEILPITYAPYGWLFPRMAAVVHHGGSGTSGFGFRSAVPSLIIPFGFDQFYWGARAAELGVGPEPVPFRTLTANRLAAAIETMVSDIAMRRRAADLGRKLSGENGVQRTVEIIEKL